MQLEWLRIGAGWQDKRFDFELLVNGAIENNNLIKRCFARQEAYEPEVTWPLMRVLQRGDAFIDVGANMGYYTCMAAQLVGEEGLVIAFEPGENVWGWFAESMKRNSEADDDRPKLAPIEWVKEPATDIAGQEIDFFLNGMAAAGNALYDPALLEVNRGETHVTKRLLSTTIDHEIDRLAQTIGARPITAIKIDTEGAEQKIIEGAVRTIMKHRPKVVITELHEQGLGHLGGSQMGLRRAMASLGYWTWMAQPVDTLPVYIPPGTEIHFTCLDEGIVPVANLMFATPRTVESYWPQQGLVVGRDRRNERGTDPTVSGL